jgi:DNA-binding LacI/PurR family transcriptional regulator
MARTKYLYVAERLRKRIQRGDYQLNGLPSERGLAVEAGVSVMTARKAVQKLVHDGLLARNPNGRLRLRRHSRHEGGLCRTALLVPAFDSSEVQVWQGLLTRTASEQDCSVRVVHYAHWDDPTVPRALSAFEGVFLVPLPGSPPEPLTEMMTRPECAVAVIDHDWSLYGVPSLRMFPLPAVQKLLDHLYQLGARRIGCMNVQPEDPIVLGRIQQWRMWMARHQLQGPLVHEPTQPFAEPVPAAHRTAREFIRTRLEEVDALLCITEATAIGVVRALADDGRHAGADLAVCSVNGQLASHTVPSITSLARPDASSLVASCMQWMRQAPHRPWIGPLIIEPAEVEVAVRESTSSWRPAAARQSAD